MDSIQENFLFEKMKSGCSDSFEMLYENFASRLFAYGKKLSRNEQLIEDTIHDVFLKLWNKRTSITIQQSFSTYFFTTFKRDLISKIKLENQSVEAFNDEIYNIEKSFLDVLLENQIQISKETRVRNAINSLPDNQREVIFLKFIEGMDTKTIALHLDIKIGTVHNLYSKAYKNLLSYLKQNVEMLAGLLLYYL